MDAVFSYQHRYRTVPSLQKSLLADVAVEHRSLCIFLWGGGYIFCSQQQLLVPPILLPYLICQTAYLGQGFGLCLIILGCHNKCPRVGGFNNRNFYFTVLKIGSSRSRCQQSQYLERALSLGCRWPPFYCVFTWPFLGVWRQRERKQALGWLSLQGH